MIGVDQDFMMRVWARGSKKLVTALLLRPNQVKKLTCAAVDHKEKYLAVGDEEGVITIHNIHSGGVLHTLPKIGVEVT